MVEVGRKIKRKRSERGRKAVDGTIENRIFSPKNEGGKGGRKVVHWVVEVFSKL